MKSITIATTLLVVVFALAVVGFAPPRPGIEEHGKPPVCLAAIPDITTEQLAAINDLHESHRAAIESTHEEMMPLRDSLHEEMQKPEPSTSVVRDLLTRMSEIRIELTLSHLEIRQETRELLTADQQAFFDEMQRGMGSHGPHHGGGRPMHDGPPPGGPGPGSGDAPRDGSGRG